MDRFRHTRSSGPQARHRRGFTLLEVMVSVAILGLAVVPMLLTRERCYDIAFDTKISRSLHELAHHQLAQIAMTVFRGEGAAEIEGYPGFFYEYSVSIYDFRSGLEEDDEYNNNDRYNEGRLDTADAPRDAVFADEDVDEVGPLMARHVVLKVFASEEICDERREYVIDTYIPLLMTDEQYEKMTETGEDEEL